ncbi:MAG: polyprenyl synthetase family protein [Bacteriovoracales bacterium]|nr:polyprenyl synthetase family protein [Bacteriovoracales bacterium]
MDFIEKCREEITSDLKRILLTHLPRHEAAQIYRYALLPPGKLFRPLLVRSMAWDRQDYRRETHSYLELFVEIHHVYTLVHDDLPCMDDDSMRRGKESTHQKFNEWKALLCGDGLNTLSFHILSLIESPRLPLLFRYVSWALGPKGLVHGQYLDLASKDPSPDKLLRTYKLKTSRLIQTALVAPSLLSESVPLRALKDLHLLGEHIGIAFQLLDDLSELTEERVSPQELEINSFLLYQDFCLKELEIRWGKIEGLLKTYSLSYTRKVLGDYLKGTTHLIADSDGRLKERMGENLKVVQEILHRLSF